MFWNRWEDWFNEMGVPFRVVEHRCEYLDRWADQLVGRSPRYPQGIRSALDQGVFGLPQDQFNSSRNLLLAGFLSGTIPFSCQDDMFDDRLAHAFGMIFDNDQQAWVNPDLLAGPQPSLLPPFIDAKSERTALEVREFLLATGDERLRRLLFLITEPT